MPSSMERVVDGKYGKVRQFTCYTCGFSGQSGWTEEDAEAEYAAAYGPPMGEERETICDSCHKKFTEWFKQNRKGIDN
jgi:hypothetical protein